MRQLNPVSGAMRYQFGVMNAGLNESIVGIEVVKATAQEAQERRKFFRNASRYRDHFVEQGRVQARYLPLLLIGFALTGAFAHSLLLVSRDALSVGELVAYMGLVGVLRFPTFISIFTFSLVQLGLAGAERILGLIEQESELDENPGGHSGPIGGEVFDDVGFAFGGGSAWAALRNLSFRVEPGETVAIVGQTGSGKSTLTRLVNRIYDVESGNIAIDGRDVREWNLESLRSQISVIEQDVFLFSRSIAEHIAFGLGQHATVEAIEAAARAAQAHDIHSKLPGRLRHRDRRTGRDPFRGAAAAAGDRPGTVDRPSHSGAGRLHQRHRQCHRRRHPAGHQPGAGGPHHLHHHPPTVADSQGQQDPGAAPG